MKNKGFTLVELMIVIVILGILVSIAYPSYQQSVRDSRRGVAKADLLELAADLERHYTTNYTYIGASLATQSPQQGATKYYTLGSTLNASSFALTATPKNAQLGDYCGTLTYDSTEATSAAKAGCW